MNASRSHVNSGQLGEHQSSIRFDNVRRSLDRSLGGRFLRSNYAVLVGRTVVRLSDSISGAGYFEDGFDGFLSSRVNADLDIRL